MWKNRIIKRQKMKIGDIAVNERNPKTHPTLQAERLTAVLDKFGRVGEVLAFYDDSNDGVLTLFDGHHRQEIDQQQEWDVAITDLTRKEVDELVLYYDPLTAMAKLDKDKTEELLRDINADDETISNMLQDIAKRGDVAVLDDKAEDEEEWECTCGNSVNGTCGRVVRKRSSGKG